MIEWLRTWAEKYADRVAYNEGQPLRQKALLGALYFIDYLEGNSVSPCNDCECMKALEAAPTTWPRMWPEGAHGWMKGYARWWSGMRRNAIVLAEYNQRQAVIEMVEGE